MIHSFTVPFGAKYLTGMVTIVPPYENFSLTKDNCAVYSQYSEIYLNQSELSKTKITKIHNVCKTVAHLTCLIRAHVYHTALLVLNRHLR
jgi:hypothetical protein